MNPPGVLPPGDIADSAIGVIPGAFVGVRSTEVRPATPLCCSKGFSNEVMTFKEGPRRGSPVPGGEMGGAQNHRCLTELESASQSSLEMANPMVEVVLHQ